MWAQIIAVIILATVCLTNGSKSVLTEGLTEQNCKVNGVKNSEDCTIILKEKKRGSKKVLSIRDDSLPLMKKDIKCDKNSEDCPVILKEEKKRDSKKISSIQDDSSPLMEKKIKCDKNSEDCPLILKEEKKRDSKKVSSTRDDSLPLMEKDIKCDKNSEDCPVILNEEKKRDSKKVSAIRDDPLPLMEKDLKCVIVGDKFCSKDMLYVKTVLIKTIKNECAKCSIKGKDKAETLKASLITYHPTAWKEFIAKNGQMRIVTLNDFV